ncbi:pentatricopeptide repeat-containing protein At2g33680-like [Selaginella moellendorffii]|uniref:pentatricopeptide repeat-containing protein At2g33680-like n=1 Tax=Selaginella moellendorffii TaxID=88036 RepID=UPI000D1C5B72|nr:pentatricopeptide repeat-containing protein At2g33680-like [Selaginella moellendorffii]|eukprot:XP_024538542.1 pentatricopeptide repeat-containing protein At2g33680-like [Selaginella moellendorffii]
MVLGESLVDLYAKCGSMAEAREVFEKATQRDVVLWTALIFGYVENGQCEVAMELYESMKGERERSWRGVKREGREAQELGNMFHHPRSSFGGELQRKLGLLRGKMPEHDVVLWTCLILGCVQNGESAVALELYECMEAQGRGR